VPDLVVTAEMWHLALDVALSDPVGRLRDLGERADHRAPHHDDVQPGENEGRKPEHEEVGRGVAVLVGEIVGIAGPLAVNSFERLEIAVELVAQRPVGVIVTQFARRRRTDLQPAPHQLLAELDELRDALAEGGKLFGVVVIDGPLHVLHGASELAVAPQQPVCERLRAAAIGGHVDAARLHHDGVDQCVDAPDIDRRLGGGGVHVTIGRLQPHRLDRHHQQEGGHDREKAGDAVDLLRDAQRVGAAREANELLQ